MKITTTNQPITTAQERKDYKLQKSKMLLQDYNVDPSPYNFESDKTALIAEQRLMKDAMPEEYENFKKSFNNKRAIKYYRKKYGQEGVTKTVEKYTQSVPFLRKLLAQRVLINREGALSMLETLLKSTKV